MSYDKPAVARTRIRLTFDQAVAMHNSAWWRGLPARDVAMFQLHEDRMCMPFSVFHEAVEEALGRSVFTHEFHNMDALVSELLGESPRPTLNEIIEMVPADRRMVVWPDGHVSEPAQ